MLLQYSGALALTDIRSAYPRVRQPRACLTDYMMALAPSSLGANSDFRFDPVHECCYPKPIFVPHNNRINSGATPVDNDLHLGAGYPDFWWDVTGLGAAATALQCFADADHGFQKLDLRCTDETQATSAAVQLAADFGSVFPQGVKLAYSRSTFTRVPSNADAYVDLYFDIICRDFNTGAQQLYRYGVFFHSTERCRIALSTDGGSSFRTIKADVLTGHHPGSTLGGTLGSRMSDTVLVQCQVLNGIVSFVIGGAAVPFSTSVQRQFLRDHQHDGDNNPNLAVTQGGFVAWLQGCQIHASVWTQFGWSGHLEKFATSANLTSSPQSWGFTPIQRPYYLVQDVNRSYLLHSGTSVVPVTPPGSTIQIQQTAGSLGQTSQYDLTVTNQQTGTIAGSVPYADNTVAITRVQAKLDPVVMATPYVPLVIRLDPTATQAPREIRETISFNPGSLEIDHELRVRWGMRQGLQGLLNNTGISGTGNFALSMQIGYQHLDDDPLNPGQQHFFGYCDTYEFDYPRGNEATVTAVCSTFMKRMGKHYITPPPVVDGYYHYYAVREVAELCGITEDRMQFWAAKPDGTLVQITVPDDPTQADPHDPDPYFLPHGIGMHTWTPRDRGLVGRAMLDMIRKVTGYLCYIDQNGTFQYRPYVLPRADQPKKIFQEVADPGDYNELQYLGGRSSTEDVRNVVTTIGYDPQESGWPPFITANLRDEDSIDSPVGFQPRNFVGWEQEFLWMDARFANSTFSKKAANKLFAFMRQPDYTFNLKAWLQHDLYPLDVIYINDTKIGLGNIPFYILSIQNVLSIPLDPGAPLQQYSLIQARFLDPALTQP